MAEEDCWSNVAGPGWRVGDWRRDESLMQNAEDIAITTFFRQGGVNVQREQMTRPTSASRIAYSGMALGAAAWGAFAIGAVAIGALVIRKVAIRSGCMRD